MKKIITVSTLQNYFLNISFENGVNKIIDIKPFLKQDGITSALWDEKYFRSVFVDDMGGIAWENGYDFCPNTLYNL